MRSVLVTGGAGFIGGALCRLLLDEGWRVVNLDVLTYAGNPRAIAELAGQPGYRFYQADIRDGARVADIFDQERPEAVVHLAAESHVDRSIGGPAAFVSTNVLGTATLLEAVTEYWRAGDAKVRERFRFVQVSTDEVWGDLPFAGGRFNEDSPYAPSSPYSASKAGGDHLARAWGRTYGLPVIVTHCGNNYGPRQHPEKFIPTLILAAAEGRPLPVYGEGRNVRDWIHVEDHARALIAALERGRPGERYAIGARCERTNMAVAEAVCALLDARRGGPPRRALIRSVPDRPGHDLRYAIHPAKAERELGWTPRHGWEEGLASTVDWYLANPDWWEPARPDA